MISSILPFPKSQSCLMQKAGISKGLEASPYAQWDPHAQKRSD